MIDIENYAQINFDNVCWEVGEAVIDKMNKHFDWIIEACPEIKEPDIDQQQWLLWGN